MLSDAEGLNKSTGGAEGRRGSTTGVKKGSLTTNLSGPGYLRIHDTKDSDQGPL